jgi:hypothetical protein
MREYERTKLVERVLPDRVDLTEIGDRLLVDVTDDLVEEVFLRPDVVVQAALEDPDLVGDVLDRGRLVSLLVEDAGRRLEDLLVSTARRARCGGLTVD